MSKDKKHDLSETGGLIPELRFPEFDRDGEWEEKKLGEVYSFLVTNSLSRAKLNYESGYVKNIHYGDIHTQFPTLFDITKEDVPYINPDISLEKIRRECYCKEGDIIFADASENLGDIGKSIEIMNLNNEKLLSGLHTLMARQFEDQIEVGFGGWLFKSDSVRRQIQREAQGAKILGISKGRISNINILYPKNSKEQQRIAACLLTVDELIESHNDKLDTLKEYKKGLLQNLFPQEGETVPKVRFPEFEEDGEWEERVLNEMTSKVGSGKTPKGGEKNYKNKGRPFVRSQNVGWGYLMLDGIAFIDDETHNSFLNSEIKEEDVLLNISGASIGRSAIADNKLSGGNVNQHVCIIRTTSELNPFYLNQFLISEIGQKQIDSFQAGGNRQGLNFGQIRSFLIPISPKIKEQQKVATCLSTVDALIAAQSDKIEELQEHKKGLMQGLFPSPVDCHSGLDPESPANTID